MFALTKPRGRLETVNAQLHAFNSHDLDAFVATYSENCIVTGVDPEPVVGRNALRTFYAPRLANAELSCVVDEAVLLGDDYLVAREFVVNGTLCTETIATFEIIDGLITRASMVKGPTRQTN